MYPEFCAPSNRGKIKQVVTCKRERQCGQEQSREMTTKLCKRIDNKKTRSNKWAFKNKKAREAKKKI